MAISTVLLDLDGVVRHFDPQHLDRVEERHRLEKGSLAGAAFAPELLDRVVTGKIGRNDWVTSVGRSVGSPRAAEEWLSTPGRIDWELMGIVDELRSEGLIVAVLTNGTDTIPAEMEAFGLEDRFDGIFNSAEIGFAKPDRRAFLHVCDRLNVDPERVFFTDDTASKLSGATEIGMIAELFLGLDRFRQHLSQFVR